MALGALLNEMASMKTSLITIGGMVAGLGGAALVVGAGLSKAFNEGFVAAKAAFDKVKTIVEEDIVPVLQPFLEFGRGVFGLLLSLATSTFEAMKTVFNDVLIPLFGVFKDVMMIWFNLFTLRWKEAMEGAEALGRDKLFPFFQRLMTLPGRLLAKGLAEGRKLLASIISFGEKAIGNIVARLQSEFSKAGKAIFGVFSDIFNGIKKIFDATIGLAIKAIDKTFKTVGNVASAIKSKVTGGGSDTNIGTAVAGGVSQTFNLNIDISGMTYRSDKMEMAREISKMIEDELGRTLRATGGSRFTR